MYELQCDLMGSRTTPSRSFLHLKMEEEFSIFVDYGSIGFFFLNYICFIYEFCIYHKEFSCF